MNFNEFPVEMKRHILTFLPLPDLFQARQASSQLRDVADSILKKMRPTCAEIRKRAGFNITAKMTSKAYAQNLRIINRIMLMIFQLNFTDTSTKEASTTEQCPFELAIKFREKQFIAYLIQRGVFPRRPDYAIQMASESGQLEIVKLLTNVPGANPKHSGAIRGASINSHLEVVKYLIRLSGFDPNIIYEAIGYCSYWERLKIVKALAALSEVEKLPISEIVLQASRQGDSTILASLLGFPHIDYTVGNNLAIRVASEKGNVEVVKFLAGLPEVDASAENNYAMQRASENGHFETVKFLAGLSQVNPAAGNNYAIRRASANGHLETVKFLASLPGVNPAAENNYAIRAASQNGHIKIFGFLAGLPQVNPEGKSYAIQKIANQGLFEIFQLKLLDENVYVEKSIFE